MRVAQSCPTLCDPIDYTVHGILQAQVLEWVAFPFSRGSSQPGIEPGSPALQAILYHLSYQGNKGKEEQNSLWLDIDYTEAMVRNELGEVDKDVIRPLEALLRSLDF